VSELENEIAEEMGDDNGVPDGIDPETGEIIEQDGGPEAPEAAAPPPPTEKQIEARMRALEKQAAKHAAAVEKIMGDDFAMLVPSPVDWTPGFIFNVPGMQPMPEQVAELHALLGDAQGIEYLPAEDATACEKCNALGEVLTGSRKPGQEKKLCVTCNGSGWVTKPLPLAPVQQIDYSANSGSSTAVIPNQPIAADRFGRPYGHPHYGLDPAQIGV
jgi:hypothetical protein